MPAHTRMPVKTAIGTVPNVNRLAAALREVGGKVFWIDNTTNAASLTEWSNWFAMSRPELLQERIDCFQAGTPGHALYPDLEVRPEDDIVYKYRFSAFVQGASDLPQRLTDGGFEYVLFVGTVTNVCCEGNDKGRQYTAREGAALEAEGVLGLLELLHPPPLDAAHDLL